jgi:transcriptional regulator with XRE-family HTH domain
MQESAVRQTSKPTVGIRAMRDRLVRESVPFRSAVEAEAEIERFCQEVRNDLRELRLSRNLDQSFVAKQLDMTQSAVSKVETSSGDVGIKTMFRYARALGFRPVCVFIPSAEQLFKDAPTETGSKVPSASVPMTQEAAVAFEEVQVKLVRSVSDSVSNVINGFARAG